MEGIGIKLKRITSTVLCLVFAVMLCMPASVQETLRTILARRQGCSIGLLGEGSYRNAERAQDNAGVSGLLQA